MKSLVYLVALPLFGLLTCTPVPAQPPLLGHWPLQENADDVSQLQHKSQPHEIRFVAGGPTAKLSRCAEFDGRQSVIDIRSFDSALLGKRTFSIAAWIHIDPDLDDTPGDLVSLFDPVERRGLNLSICSHGGVTNSQPNHQQLHFGIDGATETSPIVDHGQLANAVFVFALCVHDGRLYAATCHSGPTETGRVFRFEGDNRWTDLGSPDQSNSVSAMISWHGELYVATSKYRLAGSSLTESANTNFGGRVFKLGQGDRWVPCGQLSPETEAVASLVAFKGELYATSLYKPAGFYRFQAPDRWVACALPDGKRVEATTVFNGQLYGTCYDEGSVFQFDGQNWQKVGAIPGATQTYGLAIHDGSLFVSEWPQAHVYRYRGGTDWQDAGRLGNELEAMPLLVYNGKMYGGTLPSAELYRYENGQTWSRLAQLDATPDVKYRRAWSMAVYQGRLFVGTLPSGHVLSLTAGQNVTLDRSFPPGWHHVAAVRAQDRLNLFVDGKLVSQSPVFDSNALDLKSMAQLRIGFGAQDYFHGKLADLRIYQGVLSESDLRDLAQK